MFVPSSELLPPPPLPQASVSPPWNQREPLLAGEGMKGAISDDLRESLALGILCGLNRTVPTLLRTYYPLQEYIDLQYIYSIFSTLKILIFFSPKTFPGRWDLSSMFPQFVF